MTTWTQAHADRAQERAKAAPPRPPNQPAAPTPTPAPVEAIEAEKPVEPASWLLDYRVAAYHYEDNHRRIVFTGIPTEQVPAFLVHCQQYTPAL